MAIDGAAELDRVRARDGGVGVGHRQTFTGGLNLTVVVVDEMDVDGTAAAGVAGIGFLIETDPLALSELLETLVLNGRTVEKQVAVAGAAIAGNEAEAFVADRLDRSGCHR
jgi:hypothetical protein